MRHFRLFTRYFELPVAIEGWTRHSMTSSIHLASVSHHLASRLSRALWDHVKNRVPYALYFVSSTIRNLLSRRIVPQRWQGFHSGSSSTVITPLSHLPSSSLWTPSQSNHQRKKASVRCPLERSAIVDNSSDHWESLFVELAMLVSLDYRPDSHWSVSQEVVVNFTDKRRPYLRSCAIRHYWILLNTTVVSEMSVEWDLSVITQAISEVVAMRNIVTF